MMDGYRAAAARIRGKVPDLLIVEQDPDTFKTISAIWERVLRG